MLTKYTPILSDIQNAHQHVILIHGSNLSFFFNKTQPSSFSLHASIKRHPNPSPSLPKRHPRPLPSHNSNQTFKKISQIFSEIPKSPLIPIIGLPILLLSPNRRPFSSIRRRSSSKFLPNRPKLFHNRTLANPSSSNDPFPPGSNTFKGTTALLRFRPFFEAWLSTGRTRSCLSDLVRKRSAPGVTGWVSFQTRSATGDAHGWSSDFEKTRSWNWFVGDYFWI